MLRLPPPDHSDVPAPRSSYTGKRTPNTPIPRWQQRGVLFIQETQQPGMLLQDFGEQVTPPGRDSSGRGGTQLFPTSTKGHAGGVFGFLLLAFHPNVALG